MLSTAESAEHTRARRDEARRPSRRAQAGSRRRRSRGTRSAAGRCGAPSARQRAHGERVSRRSRSLLVVPGPDRRPQPGTIGDVAQDHPGLGQQRALGLGVGAREGDERARPARRRLAAAARRAARRGAAASVRARSCTAAQPAVGEHARSRRARTATRLGAQRQACRSAARPRAGWRVEARARVGEVAVAAPRDAEALAQARVRRRACPVPSGPHSHFCPAPA